MVLASKFRLMVLLNLGCPAHCSDYWCSCTLSGQRLVRDIVINEMVALSLVNWNRVKSKKYGARILEVVAQTVAEHSSSSSRPWRVDSGSVVPPNESLGNIPKRPREAESGEWKTPRVLLPVKIDLSKDDIENDFMCDTNQLRTTKRSKLPGSSFPKGNGFL